MNALLLITLLIHQLDVSHVSLSQNSILRTQDKKVEKKERRVRLAPFGSLILPKGYKAFRLKGYVDAWYGYFVSADCSIRVDYSSGLVQTPFETDPDNILWVKTEPSKMGLLKYGVKRTNEGEQIIASIGNMNFYMPNKKESDLQTMLDLLRTFEVGQCKNCEPVFPESPSSTDCTG